ncbi:hypothetical protein Tco_0309644 [Tanacetum coccineum]
MSQLILPLPIFCSLEVRSWSIHQSEDHYEVAANQLFGEAPRFSRGPGCEIGESSDCCCCEEARTPTHDHRVDHSHVDLWRDQGKVSRYWVGDMTTLEMVNRMRVSYQVDVRSRESSEFYSRHHDAQKDVLQAVIESLRMRKWHQREPQGRTRSPTVHQPQQTTNVTVAQLQALIAKGVVVNAEAEASRMFPEEIDNIEKYIDGLPDMIHGSVKASKPKTMQEAIEFITELVDEKTLAYAERQAERKRKYDDLSKNNQNNR